MRGEVVVRGWVYEVGDIDSRNSAFCLAVKAFGGELSISNGSVDFNAVTFKGPTLSLRTTTRVGDGKVIVLGGLVQDQETKARSHVAWLPRCGRTQSRKNACSRQASRRAACWAC